MKQYKIQISHTATACLWGVMALLTSCEKSDNAPFDLNTPDREDLYVLQPPTIHIEPFGESTPATRAAVAIKEERQAFNIGEELGNIITLGNSEANDIPQTRALASGIYYRIVVYNLSEWEAGTLKIQEQRLCKIGQTAYSADAGDNTAPIYLSSGNYRIFCYSFNTTTPTKLPKLADGAVNVELISGDDFLSSDIISKSITSDQLNTNATLGTITLKHRCCRLTGTLVAEAFGTGISSSPEPTLSVTSTFTSVGNWSIKNTSFSGTAVSNSHKVIPLSASGDTYTGSMLLLPFTSKPLTASYTYKPNGATENVSASGKSVSESATFTMGKSYSFTIKAVNAYIITDGVESIKIGTYTWATRNCRWNNTFETNLDIWNSGNLRGVSLGITSDATINSDYNSYFNWGRRTPSNNTDYETGLSWSPSQNPCPSGYSVPTSAHFKDLVNYKIAEGKKVYINGEIFTINNEYGFYKGSLARGLVLVDGINVLFLPAADCRNGASWGNIGSYGSYWSCTANGTGAYILSFASVRLFPEYNRNRGVGYSVRCVK